MPQETLTQSELIAALMPHELMSLAFAAIRNNFHSVYLSFENIADEEQVGVSDIVYTLVLTELPDQELGTEIVFNVPANIDRAYESITSLCAKSGSDVRNIIDASERSSLSRSEMMPAFLHTHEDIQETTKTAYLVGISVLIESNEGKPTISYPNAEVTRPEDAGEPVLD